MASILLSAHVIAGILFMGPVALTKSLFPRFAAGEGHSVATTLHSITRVHGALALSVPVVGLLLAGVQSRLGEFWIVAAMVLTAIAGGLLALRIVPLQREALDHPASTGKFRSMRLLTGLFNLIWVMVVVMMVVRPGATS